MRTEKLKRRRASLYADAKAFNRAYDEVFARKRPELKWQPDGMARGFGKKADEPREAKP